MKGKEVVISCLLSFPVLRGLFARLNSPSAIEKLALAEYGVANYCRKMAVELDPNLAPPDPNHTHTSNNSLAWYLFKQYHEERLHGQMLAALISSPKWDKGGIGKVRHPGQVQSKVEGIATEEPFRSLFSNKRASDFSLADRLAVMSVLESYARIFYELLSKTTNDPPLQRLAKKISLEEKGHKAGLYFHLRELVGLKAYFLIAKWHLKMVFVLPKAIGRVKQLSG